MKSPQQPTLEEALASINRAVPFSDEAEKGVISCIIQDSERVNGCRIALQPDAFYHTANRIIYTEVLTMEGEGLPLTSILITNRLRDQGNLDIVGGAAAVSELCCAPTIAAHFKYYRDIVLDKWKLRRGIHGRALAILKLYEHGRSDASDPADVAINAANQIVQSFDESTTSEAGTTATLSECLMEHVDHMEILEQRKKSGEDMLIPTGFPTLDKRCGGISQDEYWLITGPTKSGKSVLAGCIARHAARRQVKTKIYTNEVSRRTYAGRMIVGENEFFDGSIERKGWETRKQQEEYGKAVRSLQDSMGKVLKLDNAAGKYVEDIVADMRAERDQGVRLFVVDLIGKVRTRQKLGNREQELALVSQTLCDATKRLGVACIALAQENEDGQVRESRSLSFDCEAWIKIAMVREEKAKGRSFSSDAVPAAIIRDKRNLVIELARGFASGDVIPCFFNGAKFLIQEISREQEPQPMNWKTK